MAKVRFIDWNMFPGKELKKMYNQKELIAFADDLLDTQISMIGDKLSDMDIHICTTGTINPKYYKTHRQLGGHVGLKVWIET